MTRLTTFTLLAADRIKQGPPGAGPGTKIKEANTMKDYLQIRIDTKIKEQFRQVAEAQNPGLPKNQVMSAVVREMIVEYVKKHEGRRKMEYLQELTGQESGIVIYGREGILCNWSGIKGLPRIFATGLIGLGEEIPAVEGEHTDDLSGVLEGVEINVYANYTDEELSKPGTVYELSDDVVVVAPDGWA